MAGLVPAIHVLLSCGAKDVDARNKCGHDGLTIALADRGNDLLVRHIERLRRAYAEVEKRRPFRFDK
jgi:hypothetical protein